MIPKFIQHILGSVLHLSSPTNTDNTNELKFNILVHYPLRGQKSARPRIIANYRCVKISSSQYFTKQK